MSNNRLNRFLNGKGFYVVLGICMIAIGVSAWSAINKSRAPTDDIISSDTAGQTVSEESYDGEASSGETLSEQAGDREANKNQEGVEDKRDYQSKEEEGTSSDTGSISSGEEDNEPLAAYFVYPVVGEVIKKFSDSELQYSVTFNDMRLHKGIDIKAPLDSEVKSAGDGKILEVKNDPSLGYTVKIDHGNKMTVIYAGLQKDVRVKKGEVVLAGTVIGKLGTVSNECLDAPHLHLEFFEGDKAVDPLNYLS